MAKVVDEGGGLAPTDGGSTDVAVLLESGSDVNNSAKLDSDMCMDAAGRGGRFYGVFVADDGGGGR